MKEIQRKPSWLRKNIYTTEENHNVLNLLKQGNVNTVCVEARCPNRSECFHERTATFLILGKICSRSCRFCSVESGTKDLMSIDTDEPQKIASLVKELKLNYVVITSVTRDDLNDGGSTHFVQTVNAVRESNPSVVIELLTPDFRGDYAAINRVVQVQPNVYNHNIETVERITGIIRNKADYKRSLSVLECVKNIDSNIVTKSGLMLGFGEKQNEVIQAIKDLKSVGCDMLTIGQYLQPSKKHYPVQEYIPEPEFTNYKEFALEFGISVVHSGSYVRSSYRAYESYRYLLDKCN